MKRIIYIFLLTLLPSIVFSQIAGTKSFYILDAKTSARVAGLGGDFLPLKDNDITIAISNPSIINKGLENQVHLGFVNQYAGANYGLLSYSKTFSNIGSFVGTLQYVNLGRAKGYNEYDERTEDFGAADYAFILGWGRELDSNFSIGANLKPISSTYETYSSFALAVDLAANYHNSKYGLDVSFLAKNIGAQLSTFSGTKEDLPFQMELGVSKKFSKAPLRLFLTATHLEKWDLRYEDPLDPSERIDPLSGDIIKKETDFGGFMDNLFRHSTFGVEITPTKALFVRVGYNYRMYKEMAVGDGLSFTGLTYGLGVKIKQFSLSYSRGNYHSVGSPNYLSLVVDLNSFFKGAASARQ